jgi:hypothetical protein
MTLSRAIVSTRDDFLPIVPFWDDLVLFWDDRAKIPVSRALGARGAQAARDSVRGWPEESIVSSLIGLRHTLCR